ncbi:hypothetical protein [Bacillus cereus]|uniref:Uncharacterized protein n=1 Tax=Bacillus cereus TaxID=1396 RepID=A0A164QEH5_BACCE|nr:hypothetical protein [Bacillus cereus]KZD71201.1 hypothetical protein B4088_0931 [Bacillus cereus]HDR8321327.1 hypothetical protein [Bacillus cereus]HDR8331044.1 hypothetical protein [Bacillus cereus]HDR8334276.1 hypothetical protein [Bacillus cereus]
MTYIVSQFNEMKNELKECVAKCNPNHYGKEEYDGPTKRQCKDMLDFMKKNKYGEKLQSLVKKADKTNNAELMVYSMKVFSCYIRYRTALEKIQLKTEIRDPELRKRINMV